MKRRNLQIDTLRGIACIFLVAYHVVGIDRNAGLRVDSGLYRELNDILIYIRMPLFTFLSGIVYAYRPFSEDVGRFLKGKFRRLIVPMLVVGTFFAFLQTIVPGVNAPAINWHLLHIVPVAHFWFIEAIFLIFLVMIPLEQINAFQSKTRFLGVLLASSVLYISGVHFKYFSVSGALYLFPFFLSGMALQRFSIIEHLTTKVGILLIGGAALILSMVAFDVLTIESKRSTLGLMLGIMACVGLLSMKMKSAILAEIGVFSYSIYLYHVFFTAGARISLNELNVQDINVLFLLALAAGIIGPIVVERVFDGTNLTRIALLGKAKANVSDLWLTKRFTRENSVVRAAGKRGDKE